MSTTRNHCHVPAICLILALALISVLPAMAGAAPAASNGYMPRGN